MAEWREGACHCGKVTFRVRPSEDLRDARRCNCSLCRMRGAVVASTTLADLEIVSGADMLREYRFNTRQARHFFCGNCGIYTHHQRRSNPSEFSFNVACLTGISPFDFAEVPVFEGQVHHSDRPDGPSYAIAGHVLYRPDTA